MPPTALTDLPVIGWLLDDVPQPGPDRDLRHRSSSSASRSGCSGRAGACARAPSASTRRRPRPSASTSSGSATERPATAASSPGWPAPTCRMEASNSFQAGMTGGRGFIGLAAMIVGRWTPIGAFGAALLFSSSQALGQIIKFAPPTRRAWRRSCASIPGQFYDALPYLVTIVVLAGVRRPEHPAGRRRPAVRTRGRDLTREERDRGGRLPRPGGGPRSGPGPRRRGHRASACGRPGGSRWSGRRRTRPASYGVFRYLLGRGLRLRAGQPERARRSSACPAYRPSPTPSPRPVRFDIVDVFRRPELCVPHAARSGRGRARAGCGSSSGSSTGRRRAIAHAGGLEVVMDRCTSIELAADRRTARPREPPPGVSG